VNPEDPVVPGGGQLHARLTITVPADVKPGGYWCALSVDEMPDPLATTPDGVGVQFLASVSTGIYVYVNPVERGVAAEPIAIVGDRIVPRIANPGTPPAPVEGRYEFFRPTAPQPTAVLDLPRKVLLTEPVASAAYTVPLPDVSALPSAHYRLRLVL